MYFFVVNALLQLLSRVLERGSVLLPKHSFIKIVEIVFRLCFAWWKAQSRLPHITKISKVLQASRLDAQIGWIEQDNIWSAQ